KNFCNPPHHPASRQNRDQKSGGGAASEAQSPQRPGAGTCSCHHCCATDYAQVGNWGDTLGSRAEVSSSVGDRTSPTQATGMYSCRCWKPLPSATIAL